MKFITYPPSLFTLNLTNMKSIKQVFKQDRKPFIVASILMFIGLSLLLFGFLSACKGSEKPVNEKPCNTEYQFNVDNTGYDIYSDGELIGRINYGSNPTLDSLIDNDNR